MTPDDVRAKLQQSEEIEEQITVLRLQLENVFETYKAAHDKYMEIHDLIERFEKEAAKLRGEEV